MTNESKEAKKAKEAGDTRTCLGCAGTLLAVWFLYWLAFSAGIGPGGHAGKIIRKKTATLGLRDSMKKKYSVSRSGKDTWKVTVRYCGIDADSINKIEWQQAGQGTLNKEADYYVTRLRKGHWLWQRTYGTPPTYTRIYGPKWIVHSWYDIDNLDCVSPDQVFR